MVLTVLYRVVVEEPAHETEQRNWRLALLRQYNPHWDADVAHCEEVMRVGSKSFFLATWLLPGWMRGPSLALYSFCRKADDDVDEGDAAGAAGRLERLHRRLRDAYAGQPADTCVDRAFSACVRAFEVPIEITEAIHKVRGKLLLEGGEEYRVALAGATPRATCHGPDRRSMSRQDIFCELLTWKLEELGFGQEDEFVAHDCPFQESARAKDAHTRKPWAASRSRGWLLEAVGGF